MFKILFLLSDSKGYILKESKHIIENKYPNKIEFGFMNIEEINENKELIAKCIAEIRLSDFIFISTHGGIGIYRNFYSIIDNFSGRKKIFIKTGLDEENKALFPKINFQEEEYTKILSYYQKSDKYNYYNMILYIASTFGPDKYVYELPKPSVWEGIYHPKEEIVPKEYLNKIRDSNKTVVGILFYSNYVQTNNTKAIDYIIYTIEKHGAVPLPIYTSSAPDESLGRKGINWTINNLLMIDGEPVVDVVINTMGFSQTTLGNPGDGQAIISNSIFENLGVPVLQSIISYKEHEEWEKSIKGLDNVSLACGVYQPEFDGQLISSIFASTETIQDEYGERKMIIPVEERIEKITSLALNWAKLRKIPNENKKVAIIFHNMPPRNDMIGSAFGLDTPASVYNIVEGLKDIDISTEYDFQDGEDIIKRIIDTVSNDNRWLTTNRVIDKSTDTVKASQYNNWFENLSDSVQEKMENSWGKAPGEFMVYEGNMPVPGVLNGNIFIGLQPSRGYEDKADEVYHSTEILPPHQYIAYYKWIKYIFKADVIIHVGTHGSLEWLPGKQIALSRNCYPDICIDDIPHIYPYIIDNPGEGIQAKRRSYCALIDHLIPSLTKSGSYDYLEELDELIKQYYHALQGDFGKLIDVENRIINLSIENNIHLDLKIDKKFMEESFEEFIEKLHGWIDEIKSSLIKDGLHIFGEVPSNERFDNLLIALLRLKNGEIPSLMEAICQGYGFDHDYLLDNPFEISNDGKTNIMILDELDELSREVIGEFGKEKYCIDKIDYILHKEISKYNGNIFKELKAVLVFAAAVVKKKLDSTIDELKYLLEGVNGRFVPPGGSGCPTRGNVDILPTGRNFYSIDPSKIPTRASFEVGKRLGDDLLNRYIKDEGNLPENIAIIVYSTDTMKTYGDDISEILYLMGIRPKWLENTDKVIGIEVIPLEELKRPRIDVTIRISGLFRDTFPNLIELVEDAVSIVAALDEDMEDNYIRKHVLKDIEELTEKGINFEEAKETSLMRIFGCAPGTYGAGVNLLIEGKNWDSIDDLGEVYSLWSGHAYGKNIHGKKVKEVFKRRLSTVDATIKNEVSMEIDMFDCDDYYNYHGGLIAAVRSLSEKKPRSYSGNTSDPARTKLNDIDEETARIMRSRILNPKWFEGLKKHGYKGAQEISAMVDIAFGWDATSDVIKDWMYEEIAESYVFNKERKNWIESHNPWAVHSIIERLLEANQRGMWQAKDESIEKLRRLYIDIEGNIEECI